ncbi:hypothetical protein QN277_024691 [Acacia crassicarpa]|uniref:Uncharacterized protein n=1 Tax=Acacia crassicarpa TaxID=499986 RepID=A0AAE1MHK4_9FABA|nr:hypothetical protein QN277_024691 [Acacia crassicarpa]
MMGSVSLNDQ